MKAYRLRNTGSNSNKLGSCECCGKPVGTVYLLTQFKTYEHPTKGTQLTTHKCFQKFGHKSCLAELTNYNGENTP